MKTLAVVILNWNGAALLRKYLPKVIENTTREVLSCKVDIIVADNASTDESLEILSNDFPEVAVVPLDKNYGFTGGYNRAIAQISHDYVVLLNSDVAPQKGWIEPLVALMENNPQIAVCGPKILDDKRPTHFEYAGAAGGMLDILGYPFCRGRIMNDIEEDKGQYDNDIDCMWISGAALMIRRSIYLETLLDEDFFAHMEEIDLCWRLRNKGYRIVVCGKSAVFHLGGATLNSSNPQKTYLNFRNNLIMMVKNYNSKLWPLIIFARLIMDGMAGMMYLVQGKPRFVWAIVRAHWAFFGKLSATLNKRKTLASQRSNTLPKEIYRGLFYFAKPMKN